MPSFLPFWQRARQATLGVSLLYPVLCCSLQPALPGGCAPVSGGLSGTFAPYFSLALSARGTLVGPAPERVADMRSVVLSLEALFCKRTFVHQVTDQ